MEQVNFKEFLNYLLNKKLIIIIATAVFIVAGFIYGFFIKTPLYKSDTSIILITKQSETKLSNNDIQLNQSLVSTYQEIIKSRKIINQVIGDLKLSYKYDKLCENISVTSSDDTSIITITVTDKSSNRSYKIVNKIAEVFVKTVPEYYDISNVNILDLAVKNTVPYNVNVFQDTLVFTILGFSLCIVVLFIIYFLDNSISSVEQIEKLAFPILGKVHLRDEEKEKIDLTVKSTISEDVRTIKTNMDFSLLNKNDNVILFTSSVPSEGKSFISSNIAATLTQNKKKVLIMDCDMRLGRVNKIFSMNNKFGLSNLLLKYKNKNDIDTAIQKTKINNLYIMSRGTVPPNPPELLSSNRFNFVLKTLKTKFDYIIVDCPPVIGLSDAVILSKLVDKIVVVCSVGTKEEELKETKKLLSHVENKIMGAILNKVAKKKSSKYYYYSENKSEGNK